MRAIQSSFFGPVPFDPAARHYAPALAGGELAPFRLNGFEYEVEEAMRCVRAGLIESPRMPQSETLANLALLDELRRQLGVRYPFE